ncbi:MAG TPA: hypothetical protein VME45_07750 [Stellaceae bacterium]|nr:hypothetical protein [Stellaceae bacterium]
MPSRAECSSLAPFRGRHGLIAEEEALSVCLDLQNRAKDAACILGLLLLAGCAPQDMASIAPRTLPPGQARIWFYRVYDPSLSRNTANVDLNGARAVSIQPGDGPAFVDVAPGSYHIAPESFGVDTNQTRDVNLAAGQTIYVKILDDPNIISSGDHTEFRRDTFYTWLVPATVARSEINAPF